MKNFRAPVEYGKSELLYEEEDIAVIFVGHMAELADRVRRELKKPATAAAWSMQDL